MMVHLLQQKLALTPEMRDLVLLVHELDVEYPDRPDERITSTLAAEGEPGGFSAMSKTVGLPVAIATVLKLRGDLSLTGSLIPTHQAIYEPILPEIEAAGLRDDVQVLVGGAPMTEEAAEAFGADAFAGNANAAVRTALELVAG